MDPMQQILFMILFNFLQLLDTHVTLRLLEMLLHRRGGEII